MHIKIITYFLTTMIISSCLASTTAGSEGTSWAYSKESSTLQDSGTGREIITYAVSSQIFSITKGNETVFIDYEQLRLYRYRKSENSCKSFPLNNPAQTVQESTGREEIALQRMSKLLGSFKVIATDERRKIKNYKCLKKHILFASDLSFSQMVISPVIKQFGQDFTESMVTYWVTRDIDGFETLLKIARRHKEIYKANPLLRQIDIVGLVEVLEGVPVKIKKKIQKDTEEYTLLSVERTSEKDEVFNLPKICRQVIQSNK